MVEFLGQQNGRQGHGGRLGDEGTQQRRNAEYGEPPGSRGATTHAGCKFEGIFSQAVDGARGGDDHDDGHEEWFSEAGVVVDVAKEVIHAVIVLADERKGNDPEAEYDFYLAQEVAEGAAKGDGHALLRVQDAEFFFAQLLLVGFFHVVRPFLEHGGHEGVQNGQQEDDGGGQVEVIDLDTVCELIPEPHAFFSLGVYLQGNGEAAVLQLAVGVVVGPGSQLAVRIGVIDRLAAFRAGLMRHGQRKLDLHGGVFQHGVAVVCMMLLGEVVLQSLQAHRFCGNQQGVVCMLAEIEAFDQFFLGLGFGADFLYRGYCRFTRRAADRGHLLLHRRDFFLSLQPASHGQATPHHCCDYPRTHIITKRSEPY